MTELFMHGILFGIYLILTLVIYVCAILYVTKKEHDLRSALIMIWIILFIMWQLILGFMPIRMFANYEHNLEKSIYKHNNANQKKT